MSRRPRQFLRVGVAAVSAATFAAPGLGRRHPEPVALIDRNEVEAGVLDQVVGNPFVLQNELGDTDVFTRVR